jgi:hypothetical protein
VKIERRTFLSLAGGGALLAAAAAVPVHPTGAEAQVPGEGKYRFQAVAGLPQAPLHASATHLVDGEIDFDRGAGLVISRVMAPSGRELPGLDRVIRITSMTRSGSRVRLRGPVHAPSGLRWGEGPLADIVVDVPGRVVMAPFLGGAIQHRLV